VIIAEEQAGRGIAGNEDVGPTVGLEVPGEGEHIVVLRPAYACLGCPIGKTAIADAGLTKTSSAIVHRNSLPVTRGVPSRLRYGLEVEDQVVGDDQVEFPIAVIIDAGATRFPSALRLNESGPARYVRESSIAVVTIQDVLTPVSDEQVVKAVIVVVADGDAEGPVLAEQSGLFCYVGERTVAVVVIESVAGVLGAYPLDVSR
jgi:hypothetical protein